MGEQDDDITAAARFEPPVLGAGLLPTRFRLIRRLGSGGFGDVYQVFDAQSQSEIAVKALRNPNSPVLYGFKQEFRRLAAVRHPNLVRLHELINHDGGWMFTMDLVDGVHFNRHVHRHSDHAWIRRAVGSLIDGIIALHGEGLLHRDIKPSNVLVMRDEHVVVVDFGLVRELHSLEPQQTTSVAGTPPYMAPEQMVAGTLTEAADWYAVGVMLYEVLTGRLPFDGNQFEIGYKKRTIDPVPPVDLVSDMPADLNEVCVGLLQRDPRARLSGRDARTRLSSRDTPSLYPRHTESRPAAGRFVGRERELADVYEAFRRVGAGVPQIVHVTGASGIGKSALIQQLVTRIRQADPSIVVLGGRCHQTESVPYQGIDEVVDALSRHVRRLTPGEVDQILPRGFSMLAQVFPVLDRLGSGSMPRPREVADPTEFRTRVFLALREMLGRVADRRLVVVAIDDLQWADRDALACLWELIAPPAAPPLLLLLAYRPEDVDTTPGLRAFVTRTREPAGMLGTRLIELQGLAPHETRTLVESMMPTALRYPPAMVSAIVAESDGSPFLAQELVQGAQLHDPAGANEAISVHRAVVQRLEALSEVERDYVELVAAAGRPTPVAVIDAAAALPSGWVLRNDLFVKRLVRVSGPHDMQTVEAYHDRIREEVLSSVPQGRLQACHVRLAAAFEQSPDEDPERLAYHHERAGDVQAAAAYALQAARRASGALAFNQAARGYQQALAFGLLADHERRATHAELGDVLANAGRGQEAAAEYLRAAEMSAGVEELQLRSRAAAQYVRSGHLREGVELMESVLHQVGIHAPQNRTLLLLRVVLERMLTRLATWRANRMPAPVPSQGDYSQMDVCSAAAIGFSMMDPIRCAFYSSRFVRLACASGEPYRLCLALAGEATQVCHTPSGGSAERAAALLAQAGHLAEQINSPHATAFVRAMSATVAYLQGRWTKASEQSDEALEILQTDCTGVAWELCSTHTIGFIARSAKGEWAENTRRLPALIREAQARGDRFAHHSLRLLGCAYLLDLAADDPDKARREVRADIAAWSYKYYDIQRAAGAVAEADIDLYEGNCERAVAGIRSEWPLIVRSKLLRLPTTYTFSYLSRARAAIALAAHLDSGSSRSRELLGDASWCADRLQRNGPSWARGIVSLLRAGIASCESDRTGVVKHLTAAESALAGAEMIPFLMSVKWRLAAVDRTGGSASLEAAVGQWISTENIRKPENVLRAMAPGRWS